MPKPVSSIAVVICAYTTDRWLRLQLAVDSVARQSRRPSQVLVCIDHNPELLALARARWGSVAGMRVIENRYPGRLGSARNSALEHVDAELVAFLDDDAHAPVDWLARLAAVYDAGDGVQAVGGAPRPEYESPRPDWFPYEFDWVFGCAYRGLPETQSSVGRLIGANMSVRLSAALLVGGFHSDDHDDMDLTHRVIAAYGHEAVIYAPQVEVSHLVTAQRLRWSYFWRRCVRVNKGKVLAHRDMGAAGNIGADLAFARRALLVAIPGYLMQRRGGCARAAAAFAGLALAAVGSAAGHLELRLGRTPPSLTRGIEAEVLTRRREALAVQATAPQGA